MKSIVIHIDGLRREYVSDWIFANNFRKSGYHTILTSRKSTSLFLKFFTPDILILSHTYTLPESTLKALSAKGVDIYVNEVEGEIYNEFRVISDYPKNIDYGIFSGIFVWNNWTKNWMCDNIPIDHGKIHVVGSIRNNQIIHQKTEQELNIKRKVGIISRFDSLNDFNGRHNFSQLLDVIYNEPGHNMYYERFMHEIEAFTVCKTIIEGIINTGTKVIIRPHPNEDIGTYNLLKDKFSDSLEVDDSFSIAEFLEKVDLVVSPISTSYTEAYLMKVPIITTESIQKFHMEATMNDCNGLGIFFKITYNPASIDEAITLCNNSNLQPKKAKEVDDFLEACYTLKENPDPILKIINIINSNNKKFKKRNLLRNTLGSFTKVLIDILVLGKNIFSLNPLANIRRMKQYHYNCVLHKPNQYMKRYQF